jgi:aryl-alcohol dehydrogenase-like predicted oxidoreductase
MRTRSIGSLQVSEIGLGCMNLNHMYGGGIPQAPAQALLTAAVDSGVTLFDTAALYGFGRNEKWVGEALKPFRQHITLASKCGMTGVDGKRVIDGRPETLEQTCREALQRLQVEVIDLYYLHRWDKKVPIEDSVGALANMVQRGWIREIGLSEVSAATLRKAHAIHPIAAVQSEYSLCTRDPEIALLAACEELAVALVAFSPVGRGFLAGAVTDLAQLTEKDIRRNLPRFREPNFAANLRLLSELRRIAAEAGCTPAQLAIAWLLQKSRSIIPIPGTTSQEHLHENLGAATVELSKETVAKLERAINPSTVSGDRYPPETLREIDADVR